MATNSAHRPPPPPKLYDLQVTVVSAKHLKNVNWRNGDLKPYVILWVDPDRRLATKPDDSGSTRPVWNERFVLPLTFPPRDCVLTLEVFHSKPSETPRSLVGTLAFELGDLLHDSDDFPSRLRSFDLRRPSGRPQGKIRLKLTLIERPTESYHHAVTPPGYYYSSAPLPPYGGYSYASAAPPPPPPPSLSPRPLPPQQPNYTYPDSYSGYYSSSYYPPQPSPRPYFDRPSSYGSGRGPSAPVEYRQSSYGSGPGPSAPVEYTPYDYHRQNVGKPGVGIGTGLVAGALADGLGGLALDERVKHEEDKNAERVESNMASTSRNDRYGDY